MASWCLIQSKANDFIKAIQRGELDPLKMADMTSEARHDLLAKYVGEDNAANVNALYESKLLLKDQQQGMITWIKKTGNLNPEVKRDLISKIQKMENVLNPEDQKSYYKDLVSQKIGADVTPEEAKNIFDLSQKIKETQATQKEDKTFSSNKERMAYGYSKVNLANYLAELKGKGDGLTLNPIKIAKGVPGFSKAIRASMDDSAIFRQGWKTLMTHPFTWSKNAARTFGDMVKEFGTGKVMDEINADIVSRPNYDKYIKAGLAVFKPEDAYPTTLPEKIPVLGRAYKATETAYTGFVYRQRADIFDKYMQIADRSGIDTTNAKEIKPIASMVNSLTGRGNFGKYEGAAGLLNNVFFSARNIKSQVDTLGHVFTGAGGSNFVRREAALNLVKVIAGTAAIVAIANAVKPGSVETDPRSSDFGKIKSGNTRFDITGGLGGLLVLASRLATLSSKSTTTGEVTPLNSGKFGSKTGWDTITDFFSNKLSPAGSVIKELSTGKDFNGNPITLGGELQNLFTPLSLSTYQDLKNTPDSANVLLGMIADGLGINTSTYAPKAKAPAKSAPLKLNGAPKGRPKSGGIKFK